MPRSSECTYFGPGFNESKLFRGLELVKEIVIITPEEHVSVASSATLQHASLAELLSSGVITAVSIPKNELSDSFVLHNHQLRLLLSPETFYTFGLPGRKLKNKYLCFVDLTKDSKLKTRLFDCLHNLPDSFLFFCSSKVDSTVSLSRPGTMPPFLPEDGNEDDVDDWIDEFIEWLGVCCSEIKGYKSMDHGATPSTLHLSHAEGVLQSGQIADLWRSIVSQPWAVLYARGFPHVPVPYFSEGTSAPDVRVHNESGYVLVRTSGETSALRFK